MLEAFPLIPAKTPETVVAGLLKTAPAVLIQEKNKTIGIISRDDLL